MKKINLSICLLFLTIATVCYGQEAVQEAAKIAEKSGIDIEKVNQGLSISEKYKELIKNIQTNEEIDLKSRRQSISSLQKVLKTELEANFESAEEFNAFQNARSILNRQSLIKLNDEDRAALNKELTEYLNDQYYPFVKEERLAMQNKLAKDDKLKLEEHKRDLIEAQKNLTEKQKACDELSAGGKRKCQMQMMQAKKSLKNLKQSFANWAGTVEHIGYSMDKINNNKSNWLMELNSILGTYYENIDTANYPVKAAGLLKYEQLIPYLFLNTDAIEMSLEDYTEAGKIIWINQADEYCQLEYSLEKKARVVIVVVDENRQVIERLEESLLQPGKYTAKLSKGYKTGLYFVRLLLNGNDVDASKFIKS